MALVDRKEKKYLDWLWNYKRVRTRKVESYPYNLSLK
jgi:hypothetical protein